MRVDVGWDGELGIARSGRGGGGRGSSRRERNMPQLARGSRLLEYLGTILDLPDGFADSAWMVNIYLEARGC